MEDLAAEFGVSSRHLRRIVEQEIGVPPVALAQTQRLLLAKRLIAESRMSLADVAFASGFASVRRFNALFKERYALTPGELRRPSASRMAANPECLSFTLAFRPPLDWRRLVDFLGARGIPGVESLTKDTYRRTIRVGQHFGWLQVAPRDAASLRLDISPSLAPVVMQVLNAARALFDLDARPSIIEEHFAGDPTLGPIVARQSGLRVPGAIDGFELGLRAILGQQVSVKGATTLAGRFATTFGELLETPVPGLDRLTPTAESIADAGVDAIAALGLPRKRAETIAGFARAYAEGRVKLRPGIDPIAAIASLEALPGIGPWTAHYIALRALRWPDAFPNSDLALMKALQVRRPAEALALAEAWRPWRAYATLHLWHSLAPGGAPATGVPG
jgi:AraC family transcriptional regulator of adaptative response / DNA-3-methyladenine glycosylase II